MAQVVDLGIDLGTSRVVIYSSSKGRLYNEPSAIAIDREKTKLFCVGDKAYRMIGRTPANMLALRPLRNGQMVNYEFVIGMLRMVIESLDLRRLFRRGPRVVLAMPGFINEMERRTISSSLYESGVSHTDLVDKLIAAGIGAGLMIGNTNGHMVVDIDGGVADIAVISLGRIVIRRTSVSAGDAFDDAVVRYVRRKYSILIGELTAERLRRDLGSAVKRSERLYSEITGRDLVTGMPVSQLIYSDEVAEAIEEDVRKLVDDIHSALESTPAELTNDIYQEGIILTGSSANLTGLSDLISTQLRVPCHLADNADECVARGCAKVQSNRREYSKYLLDRRRSL